MLRLGLGIACPVQEAEVVPSTLTACSGTVAHWRSHWPAALPMPHPSPRHSIWLKINPWFVADVVPALQARVAKLLSR